MKRLITSESVTIGHPDKMCDVIADKILDAFIKGDEDSRCAVEVMATSKKLLYQGRLLVKQKLM